MAVILKKDAPEPDIYSLIRLLASLNSTNSIGEVLRTVSESLLSTLDIPRMIAACILLGLIRRIHEYPFPPDRNVNDPEAKQVISGLPEEAAKLILLS